MIRSHGLCRSACLGAIMLIILLHDAHSAAVKTDSQALLSSKVRELFRQDHRHTETELKTERLDKELSREIDMMGDLDGPESSVEMLPEASFQESLEPCSTQEELLSTELFLSSPAVLSPSVTPTPTPTLTPTPTQKLTQPPMLMPAPPAETPPGVILNSFIARINSGCAAGCVALAQLALGANTATSGCGLGTGSVSIGSIYLLFVNCESAQVVAPSAVKRVLGDGLAQSGIVVLSVVNDFTVSV